MKRLAIVPISLALITQLPAVSGPDIPTGDAWLPWATGKLNEIESLPIEEAFPRALSWLRLGQRGPFLTEDEKSIHQMAQEIIFSKPGYADWMLSRIRWHQENIREVEKRGEQRAVNNACYNYKQERETFFLGLAQLPSTETLDLLGELLEDDTMSGLQPSPTGIKNTNAERAATTLKQLQVGPIPGAQNFRPANYSTPEEIQIYRDWWHEVKDGKRDYIFGWKAWTRTQGGRTLILPRDQWPPDPFAKKPLPEKPLPPAPETEKSNKLPGPALWSALALLAAAGVYWLKKRRE